MLLNDLNDRNGLLNNRSVIYDNERFKNTFEYKNIQKCINYLKYRYRISLPKQNVKKYILEFRKLKILENLNRKNFYSSLLNIFNTTSNTILWFNLLCVLRESIGIYSPKDIQQVFSNLYHIYNRTIFKFDVLFKFIEENVYLNSYSNKILKTIYDNLYYEISILLSKKYSIKSIIVIIENFEYDLTRYEILNIINDVLLIETKFREKSRWIIETKFREHSPLEIKNDVII